MRAALREALLPVLAILAALLLFGLFVFAAADVSPLEAWSVLYQGAFGSWFSWQNTLQRAALAAVGAIALTAERIEEMAGDLSEQGGMPRLPSPNSAS